MSTIRLTRRDFFKLAAATAGLAATTHYLAPRSGSAPALAPIQRVWIPTCCNMCGGQTGIRVRVDDGRVAKIEPNPDNPIGVANISTDFWVWKNTDGAAMCPKGNAGVMTLYDPDRVKQPLKRTNPRKGPDEDPRWVAISWEEALSTIAGKLGELRDAGEAHKLIWFSEDHSFVHPQMDFCALYGTPNYFNHSNLCDVSRKASFGLAMGDERPLGDFANARYTLLFGWNPLSATKWSHLPRIFTRSIERGGKLVVVDPYLSQTAARAHEWVPIRPGADGALALALAHLLIKWNLIDRDFVEKWTVGFAEFAQFVADKTPEWAEQITDVSASTIRRIARDLGTIKPAVVDAWSGAGQHANSVQGAKAIALLNVLIGAVDRPGTLINPERHGPARMTPKTAAITQPRLDGHRSKYPLSHSSGIYTEVLSGIVNGSLPYRPRMGMVIFQNLALSVPGTATVIEALKQLEFLVVVDTQLSETAQLADIVIPGTTYLERYDLTTNWVTWSSVSLRQPVVKPIFGQLAEYEFVAELGRRLGLQDADGKTFFRLSPHARVDPHAPQVNIDDLTAWYEDYLSLELERGGPRMTLQELKQQPGACWVDPIGTRYEKFRDPLKLPEDSQARAGYAIIRTADGKGLLGHRDAEQRAFDLDGKPLALPAGAIVDDQVRQVIVVGGGKLWGYMDAADTLRDAQDKAIGLLRDGALVKGWNTPSRRCEFVSRQLADRKDAHGNLLDVLPVYRPRDWFPSADYPLYLTNWKEASHTHTRTFNNPWLMELQGWNQLAINAATAARLGIRDGDEIWVESPYSKAKALARVTEGIHPEVVGWQHGFGHWGMGRFARGKGTADGQFNKTVADPLSGMALHKEVCVKVYRA